MFINHRLDSFEGLVSQPEFK